MVKGSPPTHGRAQGRAWGEAARAEPRSLYLLENEGFHSSDEGHKRMKHKHSRNSKPQGETPLHHSLALTGTAGSRLPAPTALLPLRPTGLPCPSSTLPAMPHAPPLAQRPGGEQSWAAGEMAAGNADTAELGHRQPAPAQVLLTPGPSGQAREGGATSLSLFGASHTGSSAATAGPRPLLPCSSGAPLPPCHSCSPDRSAEALLLPAPRASSGAPRFE